MTFTDDLWDRIGPIRAAIDDLPFVGALADGSLERRLFVGYLAQDAHYLGDYARALAAAAAQSRRADDLAFWAGAARDAVLVERALHESHLGGLDPGEPSPTCVAYTGHLLALTTAGHLPSLAAGLLPCFWIYADTGARLAQEAAEVLARDAEHPYAKWVATYDGEEFQNSVRTARELVDAAAEQATDAQREAMVRAFGLASTYELLFWDTALNRRPWPAL